MSDGGEIARASPRSPADVGRIEPRGRPHATSVIRTGGIIPEVRGSFRSGYLRGTGHGHCVCYGGGLEYGDSASYGDGHGIGYLYLEGHSRGGGNVDGAGNGEGEGSPFRPAQLTADDPEGLAEGMGVDECEAGRLYMFAAGEGWMFVGRFVRATGPFGAVFREVVNIVRTGGTPWDELVRGVGRDAATFRAYPPEEAIFPIVRFAFGWAGELPRTSEEPGD